MTKPLEHRSGPRVHDAEHHLLDAAAPAIAAASRRQLAFGWWSLLVYLTIGMILEGLHGFKVGFYLDASNETRQMLWRLGHAHGTLLALVNIAFGLSMRLMSENGARSRSVAGRCLIGATVILPAGFFLGGVFIFAGDPGLPILLVPLGAMLLFVGVLLAARSCSRMR
jgi:hypothetical protein